MINNVQQLNSHIQLCTKIVIKIIEQKHEWLTQNIMLWIAFHKRNFRRLTRSFQTRFNLVTSMLVTDVGDQMYWWQVWDVDDRFTMLMNDERCWWTKKVANIMILPPTSEISHHLKVTNITMSPTSLSPFNLARSYYPNWSSTICRIRDVFSFWIIAWDWCER